MSVRERRTEGGRNVPKRLTEPRILVFTVDCWNSRNGINTFSELLSDHPSCNLANLYLREELPDDPRCDVYFRLPESAVLHSLTHRRAETGRVVTPGETPTDADRAAADQQKTLYAASRRSRTYPLRQLAREMVWKLGRWHTPALDAFLDGFAPDVILFDMSNYIHLTRIVRYAVKRTGAAAIGYIWDDTFTYTAFTAGDLWRIHRFFNRRALRKASALCQETWAITDKTAAEANAFFSTKKHPVTCRVLTKPIRYAEDETAPTPASCAASSPLRLLYTGNLLIGRMDSLLLVSDALTRLNAGCGSDQPRAVADVYTATALSDADRARLSPYVRLHDPITPTEVRRLQRETDVLLLLEAVRPPHERVSRLSFSAKLTDYLHAGRPILALLPGDNASSEYLSSHGAALCVSDPAALDAALTSLTDPAGGQTLRFSLASSAYALGRSRHDKAMITATLENSIEAAITAKGGAGA